MKMCLRVNYQDGNDCINGIEMLLTEYPEISCDGQYLIFTDDNGEDHKVHSSDFFGVEAVMLDIC